LALVQDHGCAVGGEDVPDGPADRLVARRRGGGRAVRAEELVQPVEGGAADPVLADRNDRRGDRAQRP
jgi:hypothetical protein